MASVTLTIRVKMRWWVIPYVHTLAWFCHTFGTDLDGDKCVSFIMRRGFKLTVK